MTIHLLSLFPETLKAFFNHSILKRAQERNLVRIKYHQLRQWGIGKHQTVDGRPFGGGPGMIIRVDVVGTALKKLRQTENLGKVILLDPQGQVFNQKKAEKLARLDALTLICGHYEGVDERVRNHLVDESISIGDYVLTGGEIPAAVIVDAVARLIPGVLENPRAVQEDSFSLPNSGLEYPQYTQPRSFRGWAVPEVLLSGNHQAIASWRQQQSHHKTTSLRPDLIKKSR